MTEKILENFSIAQICESGQCFRMEEIQDGRYQVIAGDRYLELEQQGNRVRFDCTEVEYRDFWRHYFDIETDYGAVMAQINPNDTYLTAAAQLAWGVRILNQDLWEMIVTFLISQQNNIVRIRRCIKNICETYGTAKISSLNYQKARAELLKLFGVGEKVADCICLFALHHLDAFPVDTHIRQVMEQHYKRGFPNRRYKGIRGIMQQYIFYYELHGSEK